MKVQKLTFSAKSDHRGNLVALEGEKNIPFPIKRVYYLWGMQPHTFRGGHAHKELRQIIVLLHGTCEVYLEYENISETLLLNRPDQGILLEGLVWREIRHCSPDAVVLVLADEVCRESDYIRNYDTFQKLNRQFERFQTLPCEPVLTAPAHFKEKPGMNKVPDDEISLRFVKHVE